MKLFSKMAAAAAVATLAVGGGATVASAYSISGGAFTSVPSATFTLTLGGAYQHNCAAWSLSGSATGADTTAVTSSVGGCTYFGFPVSVSQSGAWNLKVTGGGLSNYTGELELPAGSTLTWANPIMGCTFVMAGPQTFQNGVGGNVVELYDTGAEVELSMLLESISYTASGCPFSSGTDGVLSTNGPISIPGIAIS